MDLNGAYRALANLLPDCFDRTAAAYEQMDADYAVVAGHAVFVCNGCEDNCCRTLFRHHTLIEYAYLRKGFEGLGSDLRRKVCAQARTYRQALLEAEAQNTLFRHWCPLNQAGRCILYAFRPMICRLHGIPHILRHPARGLIQGTGCHFFETQCRRATSRPLDRSGIYKSMAGLEQTARQVTGFGARIGMTVADMILVFGGDTAETEKQAHCRS